MSLSAKLRAGVLAAAAATIAGSGAMAQANKGVPNALQGFSQNRDQPVQIEAASLEVRDRSGMATFTGNVRVVQGDTTLRCKSLIVHYLSGKNEQAGAMKTASPGPGGQQQISKLEAKGGVIVTQKDQVATGDTGLFDMQANTVTLQGNVTVRQGQTVMKGERLVVNLTSGVSRVDGGKSQGPVRILIPQNSQGPASGGTQAPSMMPKLGPRPFPSN